MWKRFSKRKNQPAQNQSNLFIISSIWERIQTMSATLNDIKAELAQVRDGVGTLQAMIADLKAAGASAVTQADLDALDSTIKDILSAEVVAAPVVVDPVPPVVGGV